ncbi:MAG: type II toxin-antitoxin system Phd/YefM family antitoxin [bacterium]|nr:type II toxin-antitoxin system Phd/YefM family antitoxin [bacterium]
METVGIRQLKAHLGRYVGKAQVGEQVMITDRGREVAVLGPLSESHRAMIAMRAAGKLTWSGGKPSGLRGYSARGEPVSTTVIEGRR